MNLAVLKRPIVFVPFLGLLLAAFVLWRSLQGPVLDTYRLESRPLVQTVVATGRVITTSRAQVGSEVTGCIGSSSR